MLAVACDNSIQVQDARRGDADAWDALFRRYQLPLYAFMKLLSQLPVPQRSALILHFLEDFSLEEIAEITGAQLGTVKSRLHYAKKALRKLLQEEVE